MTVEMLKSKIHHARITDANVNYVGSITLDPEVFERAGMYAYEKVLVVDVENGSRFETYIIKGTSGSREVVINGAAARMVATGDRIIVMSFAQVEAPPPADWQPCVLVLDEKNHIIPEASTTGC